MNKLHKNSNLFFDSNSIALLSKEEYLDNKVDNTVICDSMFLAGTLINSIPLCLEFTNLLSKKSESLEIKILFSFTAISKTSSSPVLFGEKTTSYPASFKNRNNPLWMFSSSKNFILNWKKVFSSNFSGKFQSFFNMSWVKAWIRFNNLFNWGSSFKHLKNNRNHYPCSLECWLSMTNIGINYNIIINFNSHKLINNNDYLSLLEVLK